MSTAIPHELDGLDPDPYRNLAAAVIWQAVVDLQGDDRRRAVQARSWLFSPALAWWCDLLDLAPEALLRRVYHLPVR
ncbi:MAG: hypothetical protein KKB13_03660, partial [Chloroflexi bacterium]|nr:hypothetical protein [Chloroflexota bacterium]